MKAAILSLRDPSMTPTSVGWLEDMLQARSSDNQSLIKWKHLPTYETTWEDIVAMTLSTLRTQ